VRHVSISSIGAEGLREHRDLKSTVIPNVFDFDRPRPHRNPRMRAQMRRELGMADGGILVVQPTRVVPRKGIELAIELVARLDDADATLLVTSPAGDEGLDYLVSLEQRANKAGVRLRYAADRFAPDHEGVMLAPAHSLNDAYQAADLITYPSLYEGFGNALVEAVFYGVPVVVNRYPVYDADIRPLGMRFIEIQGAITDDTVQEVQRVLASPDRRAAIARHNFGIARKHLGYSVLRRRLARLITSLQSDAA
jgi:glycosyltransferase involved in cell wall biosynthesis